MVAELFTDYSFSGSISEEKIRQRLSDYSFGLLKITTLTDEITDFIKSTYEKYRTEGE